MKRVLLACSSALVLASAAAAADLGSPQGRAAYSNWTGLYLGINGGGGWGTSRWDSVGDFDLYGGVIGGTLGYNWQAGSFVFGFEGDIDWTNIKGVTSAFCPFGCTTSNSWLATARGRFGLAIDRFMPYATGGFAFGDVRAQPPFLLGKSLTNAGWTLGFGVEYALLSTFTLKAEYLYVDLGAFNCGLLCGASLIDNTSFNSHVLRGGLNFRF